MRPLDILLFMAGRGARYNVDDLRLVQNYIAKMWLDKRIFVISDKEILAVLFFSICDKKDIGKFSDKAVWTYVKHNKTGTVCYVEKLVAGIWNYDMRSEFEELLVRAYPMVEYGAWHRYHRERDHLVTVKRRVKNVEIRDSGTGTFR